MVWWRGGWDLRGRGRGAGGSIISVFFSVQAFQHQHPPANHCSNCTSVSDQLKTTLWVPVGLQNSFACFFQIPLNMSLRSGRSALPRKNWDCFETAVFDRL